MTNRTTSSQTQASPPLAARTTEFDQALGQL